MIYITACAWQKRGEGGGGGWTLLVKQHLCALGGPTGHTSANGHDVEKGRFGSRA